MPIVRSVPASHIPVVRTTLIVLAALLASVASAAVDLVDGLDVDEGVGPSPAPGPDAPPPPVELATEGVPESVLDQAIAATQTQLLLGGPGEPGAGLFIDNPGNFRGALISALRGHGIKVIGYRLPTIPEPAAPPSFGLAALILAEAYEFYSGDTVGYFTGGQAQAFYDTLTAGAGGGEV